MPALYDLVCENCECGSKESCDREQREICYRMMFGTDEKVFEGEMQE